MKLYCGIDNGTSGAIGIVSDDSNWKKVKHKRLTYFTNGKSVKINKTDLREYNKEEFEKDFLKPYGFVYNITNLENGKVYIGQTIQNPFSRYESHVRTSEKGLGYSLHKAISKYGKYSFEFQVLKDCENQKCMNYWEAFFIKKFDTRSSEKGYNIASVNENGSNAMTGTSLYNLWVLKYGEEIAKVKLEEFKQKQKDTGKKSNRKYLTFKGHKHTEANRLKISEQRKGFNNPMFNKNPYDILVEKYGLKQADILWKQQYIKRGQTKSKNYQIKKEKDVKELLW